MFDCGALPQDSSDLAEVSVELPTVGADTPSESPVDIRNIIDYLSREAPGGERLSVADLSFQGTVDLEDAQYWVWSFHEPDGQARAYVTVWRSAAGTVSTSYDIDYFGLSPTQFVLGQHCGYW